MSRIDLKGKKLLVLGSTPLIQAIVEKAQSMGVYVVVTDNRQLDKAPAKKVADKYYDISLSDIDAVVALIKNEQIDGVLTGYTDSYIPYYLEICEKSGLPCYGSKHQFDIATDKVIFKKACIDAGVPVIPGRQVLSYEQAIEVAAEMGYPLMLKPADNSGSRGVNKCEKAEDLKSCFEYALSFSPSKQVICEKYLDTEIAGCSYQLVDGEAYLSSVSEHNVYKSEDDGSSVTKSLIYPSKHLPRYMDEVNDSVVKMLKDNGFRNGMVSFQVFVDEQSFYFCEMCYRPSGGQHYVLIEDQNGINSLELLIEYALCAETSYKAIGKKDNPLYKDCCAMIKFLGVPGAKLAVADVNGADKIEGVIKFQNQKTLGDEIGKSGTTAQVLAAVWLKAPNRNMMAERIRTIENTLKYKDENDNNLIIKKIDYFR